MHESTLRSPATRSSRAESFAPIESLKAGLDQALEPATGPLTNRLLAALPPEELARWRHRLEPVALRRGQVLYESGGLQSHVYFPVSATVSLLYVTADGQSAEVAVVGKEGAVGIALFMGGDSTPTRAVVHGAGFAWRVPAEAVEAEFRRSPAVLRLMLRFTQALMTQIAQTAVCNRHHSVDQQLCRCLLSTLDRLDGNALAMTQELIASMLGVRREGVTEAALKLQRAGLISYSRGQIEVLDRTGLERRACECYGVVAMEYARLLPRCSPRCTSA